MDLTVWAIATTYDDLGRVQCVTSLNYSNRPVNAVSSVYDGWGNLVEQWQDSFAGLQQFSAGVQYVYSDGATGGVASYVRLTDVIYPNGQDVAYGYGAAGSIDDVLSRVVTISEAGGTGDTTYATGEVAAYTYLGAGTIASENYIGPQVLLDYSANNFAAWDRFGRVVDQAWQQYDQNGEIQAVLDEYTYAYDASGNRTARQRT